jgi:hypothetical protein
VVVVLDAVVADVELLVGDPRLVTSPLAADVDVWAVVAGVPVDVLVDVGSVVVPSTLVGGTVPVGVDSSGGALAVLLPTALLPLLVRDVIAAGGISLTAGLRRAGALAVACLVVLSAAADAR